MHTGQWTEEDFSKAIASNCTPDEDGQREMIELYRGGEGLWTHETWATHAEREELGRERERSQELRGFPFLLFPRDWWDSDSRQRSSFTQRPLRIRMKISNKDQWPIYARSTQRSMPPTFLSLSLYILYAYIHLWGKKKRKKKPGQQALKERRGERKNICGSEMEEKQRGEKKWNYSDKVNHSPKKTKRREEILSLSLHKTRRCSEIYGGGGRRLIGKLMKTKTTNNILDWRWRQQQQQQQDEKFCFLSPSHDHSEHSCDTNPPTFFLSFSSLFFSSSFLSMHWTCRERDRRGAKICVCVRVFACTRKER